MSQKQSLSHCERGVLLSLAGEGVQFHLENYSSYSYSIVIIFDMLVCAAVK